MHRQKETAVKMMKIKENIATLLEMMGTIIEIINTLNTGKVMDGLFKSPQKKYGSGKGP